MRVYRSRRRFDAQSERPWKYTIRRLVALALLLPMVLLLLYLFLPWTQRTALLGSDARAEEASRSDTILVAAAGGGAGMLSVPRDTRVEIPGVGEGKINAAFAEGGPELTVSTLEGLTGVGIGSYVVIEFDGVEDIVNALGGITVDVREPIDLGFEDGRVFHIQPGEQTLSGGEALAYVRYRGGPQADIGRIGRQQQFLAELRQEIISPGKLLRLPAVTRAVLANIDTNMNPLEAARFAIQFQLAGNTRVELYPGTPQYIDGIAYWVPDAEAGQEVVDQTIR